MPESLSRLRIAGTDLPIDTHLACTVEEQWTTSGRRRLTITASGWALPALSGVTWGAGPVTVGWSEIGGAGTWRSLALLSAGPRITTDYAYPGSSWSLEGTEAPAGSVLVTVAGTVYAARQSVAPIDGLIRRRSNGAGEIVRARGKRRVRITGESTTPPSVAAGTIAVAGPLYTGSLLCLGLSAEIDSATGLYTWAVEGEEP